MEAFVALFLTTFALVLGAAVADPDLLQDICVADLSSGTALMLLYLFFLPLAVMISFLLLLLSFLPLKCQPIKFQLFKGEWLSQKKKKITKALENVACYR